MNSAQERGSDAQGQLGRLVGDWEGTTRVWFEPGKLADESPTTGSVRPVLNGQFVVHEYEGAFGGEPLHGMAIYSFNRDKGVYEAAWIDSFHMNTGILHSTGAGTDKGFSVLGSYSVDGNDEDPSGGTHWGWRTEIEVLSPDRWTSTAYNIMPGAEEAKAVETVYTRRS